MGFVAIVLAFGLEKTKCLTQSITLNQRIKSTCQGAVFLFQRLFFALISVFHLANSSPRLSAALLLAILPSRLIIVHIHFPSCKGTLVRPVAAWLACAGCPHANPLPWSHPAQASHNPFQ